MSEIHGEAVFSGKTRVAVWALRILMAALFLFAAFGKLSGQEMMVKEFGTIGLGQWFRYLTAALEVLGAIALLIPAVSGLGAVLLLLIDIGAFVAQVSVLHVDWIHTIVIGAFLVLLCYLHRAQIRAKLSL